MSPSHRYTADTDPEATDGGNEGVGWDEQGEIGGDEFRPCVCGLGMEETFVSAILSGHGVGLFICKGCCARLRDAPAGRSKTKKKKKTSIPTLIALSHTRIPHAITPNSHPRPDLNSKLTRK
ncbi:unnamed protein product [Nippostrongylus brasiliensis]|uniref:ClpX-type ZB domain-containing protein n=1 Tax=Nippostrongylus brasiliensis TaxID=27835 RepID=A0A0N4Y225_NIPBR|nr:unnamed protein product [Nippostrongylus brasiliensis]